MVVKSYETPDLSAFVKDCKSVVTDFDGSNPSSPTKARNHGVSGFFVTFSPYLESYAKIHKVGINLYKSVSMVVKWSSKFLPI